MKKIKHNQKGMSALLTIVIISAASLIMAKSVSFLSLTELEMGDKEVNGQKSLLLADSCVEEALHQLRLDNSFLTTDETVNLGDEQCSYTISVAGANRQIESRADYNNYQRNINVLVSISSSELDIISYNVEE